MSQTVRSRLADFPVKTLVLGASFATMAMMGTIVPSFADPISPEGLWYTKGQESIIKFQPCKPTFCGSVVWLKDPNGADGKPMLDTKNPDKAKQIQPMIGTEIFTGMTPADDHWKGKAYNADDGKTYDVTFTVKTVKEPNDTADVRGCILGFLCGTETFTRAAEVPGGDPTLTATAATAPAAKGAKAAHPAAKKDTAKK